MSTMKAAVVVALKSESVKVVVDDPWRSVKLDPDTKPEMSVVTGDAVNKSE